MIKNNALRHLFGVLSSIFVLCSWPQVGHGKDLLDPASLARRASSTYPVSLGITPASPVQAMEEDLWQRIRAQLSFNDLLNYSGGSARVAAERRWYTDNPQYLARVSERATPYLYHVVEAIESRHMPMELALLPIMESAYDPYAYSHGRAAGLWQIIPGTGRELGLTQDWWYDGRRDLRDSTEAALDYLAQLGERFDGDWLKALAAYNAGPGRISRAEKRNRARGKSTDFWALDLPRETRAYVPRLLALAELVAEPSRYGQSLTGIPNSRYFDVVDTGGQIELARAAELAGITLPELRQLNPGFNRWATSPQAAGELLLPLGAGERFSAGLEQLDASERVQWKRYTVRSGDTLIGIARRQGTEVSVLRSINDIAGSRIVVGETLMIPSAPISADALAVNSSPMLRKVGYRVRSGDSLARIAGKFNLSVDDILGWNEELRDRKYIHPGQRLTLYVDITDS